MCGVNALHLCQVQNRVQQKGAYHDRKLLMLKLAKLIILVPSFNWSLKGDALKLVIETPQLRIFRKKDQFFIVELAKSFIGDNQARLRVFGILYCRINFVFAHVIL